MKRFAVGFFILFAAATVVAAPLCDDPDTAVCEIITRSGGLLPLKGCSVEGICTSKESADMKSNTRIEIPDDTPEGYNEMIIVYD
ncbi:MAG: hypothetical protein OXT65_10570 [Alphaproteobacteria bacterium]|nr:hypothetical protein [Alphaproteobacteria bacterium]